MQQRKNVPKRGFVIVFDGVRKLIERNTKATEKITDNINEIWNDAKESGFLMIDARTGMKNKINLKT